MSSFLGFGEVVKSRNFLAESPEEISGYAAPLKENEMFNDASRERATVAVSQCLLRKVKNQGAKRGRPAHLGRVAFSGWVIAT